MMEMEMQMQMQMRMMGGPVTLGLVLPGAARPKGARCLGIHPLDLFGASVPEGGCAGRRSASPDWSASPGTKFGYLSIMWIFIVGRVMTIDTRRGKKGTREKEEHGKEILTLSPSFRTRMCLVRSFRRLFRGATAGWCDVIPLGVLCPRRRICLLRGVRGRCDGDSR